MLRVEHPPGYEAERRYIYGVLLGHWLGQPHALVTAPRRDVAITLAGDDGRRELRLPDTLFQTPPPLWLTAASLPRLPVPQWRLASDGVAAPRCSVNLPVLYGEPGCRVVPNRIDLAADLFGSAFFLLTRYEEVARPAGDAHGRFPAAASLATAANFLERPLANEYLEVLWWALRRLWPGLPRPSRTFRIRPSHDVDELAATAGRPLAGVLHSAAADLFRRRSPELAWRRLRSLTATRRGHREADLYNTYDWLMTASEAAGLTSAFYFIADFGRECRPGRYHLTDPWLPGLWRRIAARGHEIGLHPGYDSSLHPARVATEFTALRAALAAARILRGTWGGRQHYLRWRAPATWQAWEDAGLNYDSTLTFADAAGFRCGACYEYPAFNLLTRRPLRLVERPLVAMEATLLDYMGLAPAAAFGRLRSLRERCRLFAGDFTVLWHPSRVLHNVERDLYHRILHEA